ncbi:MAG: hypothetical protein JW871_07760 [Endomicrobiales bacterium]|nr:hypothetical protein [Endomicrobiales bacterium]
MTILENKITSKDLTEKYLNFFSSMIKAVVDIEKEIIALDAGLHADLETELIDNGSEQENLWGINLFPDNEKNKFIEYIALINIRPHQDNNSMEIENPEIRKKIEIILNKWINHAA